MWIGKSKNTPKDSFFLSGILILIEIEDDSVSLKSQKDAIEQ
jgi:hypothetical protein